MKQVQEEKDEHVFFIGFLCTKYKYNIQQRYNAYKYNTYLIATPYKGFSVRRLITHDYHTKTTRKITKQLYNVLQYHPTSGLMQILHFDWLRYQWSNINSHRVAKFAGFSFVFSPKINIYNLHLLTLLLPFLSGQLGDTKTIRPFTLKGYESIAHSASPHGLLTVALSGYSSNC